MSDYRAWRLPQMWTMVSCEDGSEAAYHLNTWERQQTLLSRQSERLRELRAELTAKWPPEKSEAARVFVDQIISMIKAMDETVRGAGQIREQLRHITGALEQAREQLKPLLEQYNDKSAAWKAFNQQALPWMPKHIVAGIPMLPGFDTTVLKAYQRGLDEQAREIIITADQTVVEATPRMSGLPDYGPIDNPGRRLPSPTTPKGTNDDRPQGSGRSAQGGLAAVPVRPPSFDPPAPLPVDDGPLLASDTPLPGVGMLSTTNLPGVPRVDQTLSFFGTPPLGYTSRTPSGQTAMRPGGVIGVPATGSTRGTAHPGGVMPGGAVGGVMPGARGGPAGGVAPSRRSTARHAAVESHTGSSAYSSLGLGGWRDSQFDEYAKRRRVPWGGDADDPWAVEDGVPPVLDAPPERRHEAGPGVIGLDR